MCTSDGSQRVSLITYSKKGRGGLPRETKGEDIIYKNIRGTDRQKSQSCQAACYIIDNRCQILTVTSNHVPVYLGEICSGQRTGFGWRREKGNYQSVCKKITLSLQLNIYSFISINAMDELHRDLKDFDRQVLWPTILSGFVGRASWLQTGLALFVFLWHRPLQHGRKNCDLRGHTATARGIWALIWR